MYLSYFSVTLDYTHLAVFAGGALIATAGWWYFMARGTNAAGHATRTRQSRAHKGQTTNLGVKLKLYHCPTYRSSRCTWLIHELGILEQVEVVEYHPYKASESEQQWYKENIHPHGTIPALVINGDQVLYEGASICLYLAQLLGDLLPDPGEEQHYYNWSVYPVTSIDTAIKTIYIETNRIKGEPNIDVLKAATQKFQQFAAALNKHIEGRDFICGNRFTTADVITGFSIFWASTLKGGVLLQSYPNVRAYLKRLRARPACVEGVGTSRDWIQQSIPDYPKEKLVFYS